jgi:death on curing protein
MMDPPITREEIEGIQASIALMQGGRSGVRDKRALEGALKQPYNRVGDVRLYESAPRRAAVLAEALVKSRPFRSCNRRTAVAAVRLWMEREDHRWRNNEEDLAMAMDDLAAGRMSRQELVLWIARNSNKNAGPHPGGDPGILRIAGKAPFAGPLFGSSPKQKAPKWLLDPSIVEKGWGKGF